MKKKTKQNKKVHDSKQIFALIQVIFCTIIVGLVLIFKSLNHDVYEALKLWYLDKINDSLVVSDRTLETPDDNALFVNNRK